jgi:acylphosphatase
MATICKRVTYAGRVQGVGFRYTAQQLATGHPQVAGYVRNLPNRDVELVAEGPAEEVGVLLAELAERMARYIEHTTVRDEAPTGQRGFRVRH